MNSDQNMYYPPTSPGMYPSYPPGQTVAFGQYSVQAGDYPSYSSQPKDAQLPPPYTQATTASNYGETPMAFQAPNQPPVMPINSNPKEGSQSGRWGKFTGLESKDIRRAFVRKVYCILLIQLLVTFGLIVAFHFTPAIRKYIKSGSGQWLYWSSYAIFLVTYLALACCKNAGRRYPINLLLLTLLTLSMAYMMGMISAYFQIESVFLAVGITAFVCLGVTLFSFQTRFDFTSCFGVLFAVSLAVIGFGIACAFTYSKILYTVYAGLGAVAFSIFLAVDTQLIMGGKRHEISAEDHVFASIMLYLDVVYIFMYILMLLGKRE